MRASHIRWCGSASSSKRWSIAGTIPRAAKRRDAHSASSRSTIVAGSAAAVGYAIQTSAQQLPFGIVHGRAGRDRRLAQRSLYTHVRDVLRPLARDDLPAAREAVSNIVGRDTTQLTSSGVAAAALESLAESFNDGIVAPAFWLARRRTAGLVRVQGAEHRRQPDRSSRTALANVRLGSCARGRSGQSHSRAPRGHC